MRHVALLVALSILPLSGCSDSGPLEVVPSETRLDVTTMVARDVGRPFVGHYRTAFGEPGPPIEGCDGNPETGTAVIEAIGVATHLGKSTILMDSDVDFMTGAQCGIAVFTAANGDELDWVFAGSFTPPDAEGNFTFSGDWEVSGGTGRFDGATGGGAYVGTANLFIGQGEATYTGSITY